MSKIMVIAKLKLNDESLLEDWKALSRKISAGLAGVDGFISRDSLRDENGLIYCLVKWESRAQQEKAMAEIMSSTDEESQKMFAEFARVVDMESMTKEILEVL